MPLPGAVMTAVSRAYWSAAKQGRLLVQVCAPAGHVQLYPRRHCVHCWSRDVEWAESSGVGTIYSYTVVHMPGHPAWLSQAPYVLAIVEIEEGPRLLTEVSLVDGQRLAIGSRVRLSNHRELRFGTPRPCFSVEE